MENLDNKDKQDGNDTPEINQTSEITYKRPHGLSILLIFSFVYNGILFLLLTAGLFFNSIVRQILEQYYQHFTISTEVVFVLNFIAVALFGITVFGLVKLWPAKKSGFWYFSVSQFIILFSIVVFLRSYDWINIGIAAGIVIIVGLYAGKMK
jgi:hypothetical protein